MDFLYALINFLLLALVVFLIGRKMISSIFSSRLERINRELDEAESPAPSDLEQGKEANETQNVPLDAQVEADAIIKAAEEEAERIVSLARADELRIRRDTLSLLRDSTVDKVADKIAELLSSEPYASRLQAKQHDFAHQILEMVKLTPGDMAYLKTHDVLYVTLTSAKPLDEDIVKLFEKKAYELLDAVGGKPSYWVRVDESLIGGFRLRIGDTVYGYTVADDLYFLKNKLKKENVTGEEDSEGLIKRMTDEILSFDTVAGQFQLGRVISVSDGICWLDGLADIMYGEVVEFECGERGMVLDIERDRIGCIIYGRYEHIESGSRVRRVGRIASVAVGDELLGRVIDPLAHALDGKGKIYTSQRRPIEFNAPSIPDRSAVCRPMHTGIKAIDALVPIGKGQRELIIGDRQTGKTSLAIDTIINQKGKNTVCIYTAIGQKDTSIADIREKLEKYGAMDYTVIVCAPASSSASFQYIAPFAACAMGEYFMYRGKDVLIVYDDLSKHAVAYRELSLLLHRPSGREAYPGDVFYLHARLLERASQLSSELGGGSMTALPIIETQAGDISAYIPTNVISITDGQIFLESELFNEGQRPAINVGLSVSRVGSAAQSKCMKQVSSRLRMNLAQYRELAGFSQFGSDLEDSTRSVLEKGKRMMAALRQSRYAPLPDWKQVILIYAVSEGYASNVPAENMEQYEKNLYDFIEYKHPEIVTELKKGTKLSRGTLDHINSVLGELKELVG